MKSVKKWIVIVVAAFFVFGLSGCGLVSKTPEGQQKTVVAKVNGEKITYGDYEKVLNQQKSEYEAYYGSDYFTSNPSQLTTLKTQVLDGMVQQAVMLQKAAEMKITVDDKTLNAEVNKNVADLVKQLGGQKKFEDQLKQSKMTEAQYRDLYKKQLKDQDTINKLIDNVTKNITVTDKDITNYYYANQYSYTEKPDTMNVSHILLKTQADAQKVYNLIKNGMKFEDAAKKYGTDGTKDQGGELGDIDYTSQDYDQTFLANALALPTGKVSQPVQTQFGYHLIRVNSRHEYKVKPLASVKAEIKTKLISDKKNELLNNTYASWESKAKITKYTDRI